MNFTKRAGSVSSDEDPFDFTFHPYSKAKYRPENKASQSRGVKVEGPRSRKHYSCEPCRSKKVKCDRKSTCANCILHNQPCYWESAQPVSQSAQDELALTKQELARMRALVDLLVTRGAPLTASNESDILLRAHNGSFSYNLAPTSLATISPLLGDTTNFGKPLPSSCVSSSHLNTPLPCSNSQPNQNELIRDHFQWDKFIRDLGYAPASFPAGEADGSSPHSSATGSESSTIRGRTIGTNSQRNGTLSLFVSLSRNSFLIPSAAMELSELFDYSFNASEIASSTDSEQSRHLSHSSSDATPTVAEPPKMAHKSETSKPRKKKRDTPVRRKHYSCQPCREKKIKCDRKSTCANCLIHGKVCYWEEAQPTAQSEQDYLKTAQADLARFRQIVELLKGRLDALTIARQGSVAPKPMPVQLPSFTEAGMQMQRLDNYSWNIEQGGGGGSWNGIDWKAVMPVGTPPVGFETFYQT